MNLVRLSTSVAIKRERISFSGWQVKDRNDSLFISPYSLHFLNVTKFRLVEISQHLEEAKRKAEESKERERLVYNLISRGFDNHDPTSHTALQTGLIVLNKNISDFDTNPRKSKSRDFVHSLQFTIHCFREFEREREAWGIEKDVLNLQKNEWNIARDRLTNENRNLVDKKK